MKCSFCGKEIDEGSTFCGYCGRKQPEVKHCVKCGQEIGLDDAFCGYCGASQNVKPLGAVEEIEEHLLPSQIREEKETDEVLPLKEPIVTNDVYDSKHEVIETNEEQQLPSLNVNEEFSREQKSHEINSESNDIESEEVVNEDKLQSGSDLGVIDNNYKPIKIICIIAALLAVAVLIVYLTNPNFSTGSENNTYVACDSTEEDMLTARIEYIFNEVYENGKDGDSCFLTSEYKSLLRKEQEVTPEGELGCFDSDRWLQAQDGENLSMTVHSVEISDLKAKANITITNFGHNFDIEIVLIKERGDWYIDDFINSLGSEKKALKDYIAFRKNENTNKMISIKSIIDLYNNLNKDYVIDVISRNGYSFFSSEDKPGEHVDYWTKGVELKRVSIDSPVGETIAYEPIEHKGGSVAIREGSSVMGGFDIEITVYSDQDFKKWEEQLKEMGYKQAKYEGDNVFAEEDGWTSVGAHGNSFRYYKDDKGHSIEFIYDNGYRVYSVNNHYFQ